MGIAAGLMVGFLSLAGCLSTDEARMGDDPALEDGQNQPFTDVYIEYVGPQEKWAGPSTLMIHVQTSDKGDSKITMSPPLFQKPGSKKHGVIPVEAAREQMAKLYASFQLDSKGQPGCLYPVRAKLIRADGVLVERAGCRGDEGWPKVASEITSHFIEAAVYASDSASVK